MTLRVLRVSVVHSFLRNFNTETRTHGGYTEKFVYSDKLLKRAVNENLN
jgi:hypothetical protein